MKILYYSLIILTIIPIASSLNIELVSTNPEQPKAGEYADITLRISASSQDIIRKNLTLIIEDNKFLTQITNPKKISVLQPNDVITHTFRVYIDETAPEGALNFNSILFYGSSEFKKSHELIIEDKENNAELTIGELNSVPDILLPDTKDNTIYVTIHNLGEKDAELISAKLTLPEGITPSQAYSDSDSISSIKAGDEGTLEFMIDIEPEIKRSQTATLMLTYREKNQGDSYKTKMRSLPIIIPIEKAPYLKVIEVKPMTELVAGTAENKLRLTIKNEGLQEAEDVRIRLEPDISTPVIFEYISKYVGTKILPGETAEVDVIFEISKNAQPTTYQVGLRLESLVRQTRYYQDDVFSFEIKESNKPSTKKVMIMFITAIIIIGLLVAVWRRKVLKQTKI